MLLTVALSAAIAAAVERQRLADGCTPAQTRTAVAHADVQRLGKLAGTPVVLVALDSSCMCGTVNCPWLVLRLGETPAVLLATYAYAVDVVRSGEALPRLREHAHDSALITDETLDAYRGTGYVMVSSARVRGDTGARKPDAVPVRFAPGSSAARLHGSASLGWYDAYAFGASRGQRLTIGSVGSRAKLTLTLFGPADAPPLGVHAGVPVTLDRNGTFTLHVENDRDEETPYVFTLSIR